MNSMATTLSISPTELAVLKSELYNAMIIIIGNTILAQ